MDQPPQPTETTTISVGIISDLVASTKSVGCERQRAAPQSSHAPPTEVSAHFPSARGASERSASLPWWRGEWGCLRQRRVNLSIDLGFHFLPGFGVLGSGGAVFGYLAPLYERDLSVSWTFRRGVLVALGGFTGVGGRIDLLGVVVRSGNLFMDFQLPTVGMMFGPNGLTIQAMARASVGFTF